MKEEKVHPRLLIEAQALNAPHNEKMQKSMNRKEFFKTGVRILLLGGLTASVGYLVVNKKVSASCTVSPTCKSCGIYTDCVSPETKFEREKNSEGVR